MEIRGAGVVVTGGGSGLGEATIRAFAAKGAQVAILDLERSNGAAIAAELGGIFTPADVTSEEAVTAALDQAVNAFGAINIVVNCAGIATAAKTISRGEAHDLALFRKVIEINLIGTFNVNRLAALRMVQNEPNADGERGVLINTSSVAAYEGQIGQVAYAASKGGVIGMTLPLARDLADRGIRSCAIAPGLFLTPMLMGLPEPAKQALASITPFPQRLGHPEEYAALAIHIVENAMLNGETIRLDGAVRFPPK